MIASLSIPWGDEKSDEELGGYHLVWTRDMVKCVSALLAVGNFSTPLRALIYLAVSQREDGGFYQNFWIDGRPLGWAYSWTRSRSQFFWRGGCGNWARWETSILSPWSGARAGSSSEKVRSPPRTGGRKRAAILHQHWRPTLRHSYARPSSSADRGDGRTAEFVRDYADFLESHVERWTVTTQGTLVPGVTRHYIRINPADIGCCADEDPNRGTIVLANQRPGDRVEFPAKAIVDAGLF